MIWENYRARGRRLSWRRTRDPYRILVSEIMLQQTSTDRVEGKYRWFLKTFPDFRSLAAAREREVIAAWRGLGYNRRALYLKRTAELVLERHGGRLPRVPEELEALPGVGRATASSVLAFAYNIPAAFIETNIRRVFLHFFSRARAASLTARFCRSLSGHSIGRTRESGITR